MPVDFEKCNGITVVESDPPNFGGKTVLTVDLLLFLFFNTTTKTQKAEEIFNRFTDKNKVIVRGEIIKKYNIGFCDRGSHTGRIVVPSYNSEGELNFFVSRSWNPKAKLKYKNPEAAKDFLIFNESLIDWKKDIYLVEGVFDGFFLDNSIALLGKYVNDNLWEMLYTKAKKNIIVCLDGDAYGDAKNIYDKLNGGNLYGRVKLVKLPKDKDVCDLRGDINNYYVKDRD